MKSTKQALTQTLGKRAGPDDAEEYAAQAAREKNMRTSMLFMELQESVSEALRWRHARDVKARKISAEIAARCPLTFPGEAAPAVQCNAQSSVDSAATVERVKPYVPVVSFEEKMKAETNGVRAQYKRQLPAPLTQAALDVAYTELTKGAERSLERVFACWRANSLASDDVLASVKSFSGSSASLHKIFAPAVPECEVASDAQMCELSRLASGDCINPSK
mmetsp:Transcript_59458/g.50346  ORF Transcript_59458/g.50346 Transcript_59458/m.50346 type:complete len:220 (+) Transcript_59458:55-714(+)